MEAKQVRGQQNCKQLQHTKRTASVLQWQDEEESRGALGHISLRCHPTSLQHRNKWGQIARRRAGSDAQPLPTSAAPAAALASVQAWLSEPRTSVTESDTWELAT